jgi:EAL domain-containing protein (putative c-di-GMP-specific phosphodiesterase class I)
MTNHRIKTLKIWIFACFVVLGFFFGFNVVLVIYPILGSSIDMTYAFLFFANNLLELGLLIVVFLLLRTLDSLKLQQVSTREFFLNENFVFNETVFKNQVARRLRRHKDRKYGVVAVLNVKDLNSEILTLYGADEVKEINEIIFNVLRTAITDWKKYVFAFSLLDSFLIYKDTDDAESFYSELRAISEEIQKKVRDNGTLPAITILIGAYRVQPNDMVDQAIQRASYASKYNVTTRFSSDVMAFSPDLMGESDNERDLSYELLRAIDEGQLEIYYQPKFDLKNKRFYGAEALIRWNHPSRGILPPALFIPFAEESGSIVDIDHYVFRHVCQDISRWGKDKKRLLKISANLSRKTVYDPTLLAFFDKTIKEYNVNPLLLNMELTESLAARDTIFLSTVIRQIKAMGISTSIDDFGVGYSSFSSLKKIPFDILKIDKSFIDDIEVDKKSRDLVECVINLGHALSMSVIAEGVQTEKQVEILRKMNLDAIQGFYYSKALSNFDYQKFLEANPFEKKKDGGTEI